ncbi:MAG: SGNH/GDSL hydrolase family protein [Eubacteriales bacterium]|nr:SGNH/GDSL hydrolase family protein [Eubacteriales bacterium]
MKPENEIPRKHHRRKKRSRRPSGHLIFLIVFSVVLVALIIRLFVWNIGRKSDYNPNETTTAFDVELMDYLQPLDPEMLEGHEDDGVTTILALGNDPLSDERGQDGLASLMEQATDASVLNAAFPGSTIAMKNAEFENSYPLDGVSLYWVTAALVNQNFELLDAIVPSFDSPAASQALETLKSVDMSTVDDLILLYDLQDYSGDRTVYDEANDQNLNTVYGALNAAIRLIQEHYPYIRIYLLSQPYGTCTVGGQTVDPSREDLGNGTLIDYLNWEAEVCRKNGISFVDNYYGAVTVEDTDCLTDGFHLNSRGRRKVAERFASVFTP